MRRRYLYALLMVLTLSTLPAWSMAKHSFTATAKASGSSNLVVLPSASVRVYEPGATASTTSSGMTVTVYDSSTISPGDTVKVNGYSATVLLVPTATTFTIDTPLSWSKGDRFLLTSAPITIYADAGGTETITQPGTASSTGRFTFFYNSSTTPTFDLEATSSSGLRYVDYAITNPGEGTSAGGWTDGGTTVTTSTNSDSVGIGGAPASTRLELVASDTNSPGTSTPNCVLRVEGDTNTTDFCWFMDTGGELTLFSYDDARGVTRVYDGAFNHVAFGDLANVDTTNPGTIIVRNRLATHRGLVLSGASGQSANMLEIRDNTEAVKISCSVAGNCTAVGTLAAGDDVTATDDVIAGDDVTATDTFIGAHLTISGTTTSFRGLTYTWPAAHVANGLLKNDGTGGLSWTATSSCAPISVKVLPTTGGTTEYFSLNSFETSTPNYAQSESSVLDVQSWVAPAAFTAANFRVQTAGTMSSGSVAYTLMEAGAATAITCTVSNSASTCTSASTDPIASGSQLALRAVGSSAVSGTVVWLSASFCLGP